MFTLVMLLVLFVSTTNAMDLDPIHFPTASSPFYVDVADDDTAIASTPMDYVINPPMSFGDHYTCASGTCFCNPFQENHVNSWNQDEYTMKPSLLINAVISILRSRGIFGPLAQTLAFNSRTIIDVMKKLSVKMLVNQNKADSFWLSLPLAMSYMLTRRGVRCPPSANHNSLALGLNALGSWTTDHQKDRYDFFSTQYPSMSYVMRVTNALFQGTIVHTRQGSKGYLLPIMLTTLFTLFFVMKDQRVLPSPAPPQHKFPVNLAITTMRLIRDPWISISDLFDHIVNSGARNFDLSQRFLSSLAELHFREIGGLFRLRSGNTTSLNSPSFINPLLNFVRWAEVFNDVKVIRTQAIVNGEDGYNFTLQTVTDLLPIAEASLVTDCDVSLAKSSRTPAIAGLTGEDTSWMDSSSQILAFMTRHLLNGIVTRHVLIESFYINNIKPGSVRSLIT